MSTAIAKRDSLPAITPRNQINVIRQSSEMFGETPADLMVNSMELMKVVRTYIASEFKHGVDYGQAFPGSNKNTLLQGGAQKIGMLLNCRADVHFVETELGETGHIEVVTTIHLVNRATDQIVSTGYGSCTSMEDKYRFRKGNRICPSCDAETIFASKDKPEWFCWKAKGGCGATFDKRLPAIVDQNPDKMENKNPWDSRNTVRKMSKKRAFVDAAHSAACLSEFFTQDVGDGEIFTEDQIAEMVTAPAPAPAAPTVAASPKQATPPKDLPADIQVMGQRKPGYDDRSYLDVVKVSVSEANDSLNSHARSIGATAPNLFTTKQVHGYVIRKARDLKILGATPIAPADALNVITEQLYPSHRAAIREAVQTFLTEQIKAGKEALSEPNEASTEAATENREAGSDG